MSGTTSVGGMPTLALIDGHSIAYRAFYALPEDLATSSGQVTNAAYGFTRMLTKLLSEHHPDAVAVAWDVSRETFRSAEYPEYKAQRDRAPDVFKSQLPLMRQVVQALDIPQLQVEGYEADDVIASLAKAAEQQGWDVLVVTGDRDAFQLVDDHIKVLYTRRGISDTVLADARWVQERYGIDPAHYVDYAALRGDSSDNLPGVPGVGEKTAARLVATYGTLEGIYEHLDELTPKLRENLAAHRDQVFLNRRLMRLVADLDLDADIDEMRLRPWDLSKAKELFTSLEFHSLWNDLTRLRPGGATAEPTRILDVDVTFIGTEDRFPTFAAGPIAVNLVEDGDFTGFAVSAAVDTAYVVAQAAGGAVWRLLADQALPKVIHDAKPLVRRGLESDRTCARIETDTALAAYVLDPASRSYDLPQVADRYLGVELVSADRVESEDGGQGLLDLSGGPDLDLWGRHAVATLLLAERLEGELETRDELDLFRRIEMPLVEVLARMEVAGIGVDRTYLEDLGQDLRQKIAEHERRIWELAGGPFNVNSTEQLREVLFEKLGLPVQKKTATGKPSTDASVLDKLAHEHPIVEELLRYRELEKLRSTYVDGYLPLIGEDGRIHTRFNQMAAATGRLSSEEPNLQNIPVRSEVGKMIRRAFVPFPGWTFVVADYSQIELRILAHLSKDPGLIAAFSDEDADVHAATAARIFGVPEDQVSPEMRRRAKVINFGLLYGMEAYGVAQRLGISREEATEHIEAYFDQFPKVRRFMEGVVAEARRLGYTSTLFGRRRYLPELKSDNYRLRQMGERMALNAPVQGTAADIIKLAMIELDRRLQGRFRARQLLQIHDELVLEAPPEEVVEAIAVTTETMEGIADLVVPLRVEVATGPNLAECKL